MKTTEITVGGQTLQLRLTAAKLQTYIKANANSAQSPLLAILDAMDSLGKQADLLTAALTWPEAKNPIRSGYALLDAMADDDYGGPVAVKRLIVQLAVDAGLVTAEDGDKIAESLAPGQEKLMDTVCRLLRMEQVNVDTQTTAGKEENPT